MLLQGIRNRAQGWLAWVIVGLISVPFALWGINSYLTPTPETAVAEVNGIDINERDFSYRLQQQIQRMQAQFQGQDFDTSTMENFFKKQVLDSMIDEEVTVQASIDSGLRIGNGMLASYIQSLDEFKQDGVFTTETYTETLRSVGLSTYSFENRVKRGLLTDQLRNGIKSSAFSTEYEQKQSEQLKNQQRLVTYITITADRFDKETTVSDEEIQKHFDDNQKDYFTEEKISIDYVELKTEDLAVVAEVDETVLEKRYEEQKASFSTPPEWRARHILFNEDDKANAEATLAKVKAGEDFAELAKTLSEDKGSGSQGGDLGFFGEGAMVEPFENAVKNLKIGEISELVKSKFGYHIIKLEENKESVTQPYAEVREQLLTDYKKEQSETAFYDKQEQFANLAFENPDSLLQLATTLELEQKSTELFTQNKGKKDSLSDKVKIRTAAFAEDILKNGLNSEVITLSDQHIVVLRLKQHEIAKVKSFDEVKEDISKQLKADKQQAATETLGKALLASLKEGKNPNETLKEHQLTWHNAQWIKRNGRELNDNELTKAAFSIPVPEKDQALYQGMTTVKGYSILAVLEEKIDSEETSGINETAQADAMGRIEYQTVQSYLKNKAKIIRLNTNTDS